MTATRRLAAILAADVATPSTAATLREMGVRVGRTEKIAYAERRVRYCHDVSQRKAPAGRGATVSMRCMKPPQSGQSVSRL